MTYCRRNTTPIAPTTLDAMLAEHEAEQHMGGRCDCATCDQVRALMVEMASRER